MLTRHQPARDSLNSADVLVERAPTLRRVTLPPARKSIASVEPGENTHPHTSAVIGRSNAAVWAGIEERLMRTL